MCGICGVIDWSETPDASALVRRMTPTMQHRGPDDEGYLDGGTPAHLALGMRRLSIIDVEGGHQPVFNEDGRVAVVLNGEIYNFQEARAELEGLGHSFKTRSDSEVIAHAYEQWGAECVERLQGMFAFAVHDTRSTGQEQSAGTLFLARDRIGIKPLYYAVISSQQSAGSNSLVFASEVRTLLASGLVPRRLSAEALQSYLLFGSVSEPMTLIEGVLSLPPGHTITVDLADNGSAIQPRPYWSLAKRISARRHANENFQPLTAGNGHAQTSHSTTLARVRTLLEESVRGHLIADVPVGVFLSGGIDSTSLAALASREVSGIHTFTVSFAEKEFNEAAIARRTAAQFGTTHEEVLLSSDEMLSRLDEAVASLDQPSIDGINTYFVSWSARQAGLKVTLSGLGGDEVFGGYSTFRRTPQFQRLAAAGARVPGSVRSAMNSTISGVGGRLVSGDATRKISALWSSPESLPDPYYFGRALFTPAQVVDLMTNVTSSEPTLWWKWLSQSAEQARRLDPFAAVSCMEIQSYLVNTLLRDTDSMSMAHSLEVRVPFLDHRLVEFVTALPQELKLRKGVAKALLVASLRDLLPDEVVNQTKRGFTFPWAHWLRGPLRERVESGLGQLSPALEESLDPANARGVWQSYLDGKTSWSRPWSLYVLNEWVKRHLD